MRKTADQIGEKESTLQNNPGASVIGENKVQKIGNKPQKIERPGLFCRTRVILPTVHASKRFN